MINWKCRTIVHYDIDGSVDEMEQLRESIGYGTVGCKYELSYCDPISLGLEVTPERQKELESILAKWDGGVSGADLGV